MGCLYENTNFLRNRDFSTPLEVTMRDVISSGVEKYSELISLLSKVNSARCILVAHCQPSIEWCE